MPYVRHNLITFDSEKRDAMVARLNAGLDRVNDSGDDVEETLSVLPKSSGNCKVRYAHA